MSQYAGDLSSRLLGGEKLEDITIKTNTKTNVLNQSLSDYRANLPKVIEKYRFTKDIELFAWDGKEGFGFNINQPKIKFKKGNIVDGFIMPNLYQSEPSSYLVITDKTKSDAMFRIPAGGTGFKGYDFIEKISDSANVSNEPLSPTTQDSKNNETFLQKHKNHLIMIGVPLGFYAFSKYKKYDSKKTLKVTIIGSVVVLGAIVLNGFSGAFSGTTFLERTFGKKKAVKEIQLKK